MPIDFSKYVYQPRPPVSFDFGSGFRDVIEARFGREKIDNQKAQAEALLGEQRAGRADTNTRWASSVAEGRADRQYKTAEERQKEADTLTQKARQLFVSGDRNGARALLGRIAELGGDVKWAQGPNGEPDFEVKSPDMQLPNQSTDTQQVRGEIFGGAPQPGMGQSFQAPSPFHAGGQPGPVKNPFDAGVPTSAASLPQPAPQAAPQPPQAPAAPPAPGVPGQAAAAASADAQQAIGGLEAAVNGAAPAAPPADDGGFQARLQAAMQRPEVGAVLQSHGIPTQQGEPQNPFNPYKLSGSEISTENNRRVEPYFQGIQGAVPSRYSAQTKSFHDGVKKLGYGPEDTLKLIQPTFGTLAGLWRGQMGAEAQARRLDLSGNNAQEGRNLRIHTMARGEVERLAKHHKLAESYDRWMSGQEAIALLDQHNNQSDVQAITMARNMNQPGVMTDADFKNARQGIVTIWQAIKNNTIEQLFSNGMNPDSRQDLRDFFKIARGGAENRIKRARDSMSVTLGNGRTIAAEARDEYLNAIAQYIPEELWDERIQGAMGIAIPQKSGNVDKEGNFPTTASPPPQSTGTNISASSSSRKSGPKNDDELLDDLTK